MIRLRQIAFATHHLAAAEGALVGRLGLELCYRDPNLIVFGLENALFPIGDQFFEIVSPVQADTTAGRLLDKRGGDCGYMVLIQVDELDSVKARLDRLGIRVVFDAVTDDIRGLHLHPKDVPGAIVSVDAAREPAEWPWAGPDWRSHVVADRLSGICGMTVAVDDPDAASEIWAAVLGVPVADNAIHLDDAVVRFRPIAADGRTGIAAVDIAVANPGVAAETFDVLGVEINIVQRSAPRPAGGGS